MTALELLGKLRLAHPAFRLAASKNGGAIGVWCEEKGRFAAFILKALTGDWVRMPYEILANGKPPVAPEDWQE
jgi:hypothetical protein